MPNTSRTGGFTCCLACLSIAMASFALAKDEPAPSSQQNQDQQQAPVIQTTGGPRLDAAYNRLNERPPQQPNRSDVSRDAQRSADQQQPRGQQGASLGVNITSSRDGVVVSRVQSNTPAQQMGLRPRDRIISINGAPAGSADEFISTIRGMNPGDQVELQIARNDGEVTIRGNLEAYGQSPGRNEQPSGNDEYRNYQRIVGQNQWSNQPTTVSRDEGTMGRVLRSAEQSATGFNDADQTATRQTSYEEKGPSTPPQAGDIDARLSRIEQQMERLTQAVEDLRSTVGTAPLSDRPTSGLREAASAEFRATNPTKAAQPRANAPLPNGETIKRNDRWNVENRFEQGDLPGARERATAEAARRRAQQTGAQLQQQERERAANAKQGTAANPSTELPPQPTATDQPPGDQKK